MVLTDIPGDILESGIHSLPASIAILDEEGEIRFINQHWRDFGVENGLSEEYTAIGTNYLDLTSGVEDKFAGEAEDGLAAVLAREQDVFEMEYPCHSPEVDRWFRLFAAGFSASDGGFAIVAHLDITERKEREDEAKLFRRAMENAGHAVYITDRKGTIEYVNPAFERITGFSAEEAEGQTPAILKSGERSEDYYRELWETISAGEIWREDLRNRRKSGELYWADQTIAPFPEGDDPSHFVAIQRDITERRSRRDALETLQTSGLEFLRAESVTEISTILVDAVAEITGDAYLVYFHYDEDAHTLVPEASSGAVDFQELDPVSPGESLIGQAWATNTATEPTDDILSGESVELADSHILIPVGSFGVLLRGVDASTRQSELDRFITLLVRSTEEALERTSLTREVSSSKSQLEAATGQLDQLVQINEEVRRIANRVLRTENVDDLGNLVCQRLTDMEPFTAAYFGRYRWDVETLETITHWGDMSGYIDIFGSVKQPGSEDTEPSIRAIETEDPVIINNIAAKVQESDWRQEAVSQGFASAIAVPIQFEDYLFGALSIYGQQPIDFPDQTVGAIVDLGETIGHVIHRIRQERALLSPNNLQLTYAISDGNPLLTQLSSVLDATLRLTPHPAAGEEGVQFNCEVEGISPETLETACKSLDFAIECKNVSEAGGRLSFSIRSNQQLLPERLGEHGGEFQEMITTSDGSEVTALFPRSTSIRPITDALSKDYVDVELIQKRVTTTGGPTDNLPTETGLTGRQTEVVELALSEGFFEWPRDISGEELAEELDIDSSTFHRHLRVGLRKILHSATDIER